MQLSTVLLLVFGTVSAHHASTDSRVNLDVTGSSSIIGATAVSAVKAGGAVTNMAANTGKQAVKTGVGAEAAMTSAKIKVATTGAGLAIGAGQGAVKGFTHGGAKGLRVSGKAASGVPLMDKYVEGTTDHVGKGMIGASDKAQTMIDPVKSVGGGASDKATGLVGGGTGKFNGMMDKAGGVVEDTVDGVTARVGEGITTVDGKASQAMGSIRKGGVEAKDEADGIVSYAKAETGEMTYETESAVNGAVNNAKGSVSSRAKSSIGAKDKFSLFG